MRQLGGDRHGVGKALRVAPAPANQDRDIFPTCTARWTGWGLQLFCDIHNCAQVKSTHVNRQHSQGFTHAKTNFTSLGNLQGWSSSACRNQSKCSWPYRFNKKKTQATNHSKRRMLIQLRTKKLSRF